jgi:biotin synthase
MKKAHSWQFDNVKALFDCPFNDLLYHASSTHRRNFNPNEVQISTLLSIKTGLCPEDCQYCPQSVHYKTPVEKQPLMSIESIVEAAKKAKSLGATRFCMGAGWRQPKDRDFDHLGKAVQEVKALGLETCLTLGMLSDDQVAQLETSGLEYYNHDLDTSPEYYEKIITTRTYQQRLDTLARVGKSSIKVCCGGIVGMGESLEDRINFLLALDSLDTPPESIPINMLVKIPGTPLADAEDIDPIEFVRMVAVARIMFPTAYIRLSAGREQMSDFTQAMAFFAGANSIHYGEKLLTTPLPAPEKDQALFEKLGMKYSGQPVAMV